MLHIRTSTLEQSRLDRTLFEVELSLYDLNLNSSSASLNTAHIHFNFQGLSNVTIQRAARKLKINTSPLHMNLVCTTCQG